MFRRKKKEHDTRRALRISPQDRVARFQEGATKDGPYVDCVGSNERLYFRDKRDRDLVYRADQLRYKLDFEARVMEAPPRTSELLEAYRFKMLNDDEWDILCRKIAQDMDPSIDFVDSFTPSEEFLEYANIALRALGYMKKYG